MRAYLKSGLIIVTGALWLITWIMFALLFCWSRTIRSGIRGFIYVNWCKSILLICQTRVHLDGSVGEEPCLLLSNHMSTIDIPLLGSQANAVFVAKKDYLLIIYNRWGQKLFETTNPANGWDGTLKGVPIQNDAYVYYVSFKIRGNEQFIKAGTVMLLR